MSAADEVQISVNDLMSAFATENANTVQRAILAEQKVKAYVSVIEAQATEIANLRAIIEQNAPAPEPEPAVAAVKRTPRRKSA